MNAGARRLAVIGGSDTGITAALRAREIDSEALFHRMKVADLVELDLSCTPPLSSPFDPV